MIICSAIRTSNNNFIHDLNYLTDSSKNHSDVRQRAAAKKELENGSLKRELDEVKEKIASLKKMGK